MTDFIILILLTEKFSSILQRNKIKSLSFAIVMVCRYVDSRRQSECLLFGVSTPLDLYTVGVATPFTQFDSLDFLFCSNVLFFSTEYSLFFSFVHISVVGFLVSSDVSFHPSVTHAYIRTNTNTFTLTHSLCSYYPHQCMTHLIMYTKVDWDALNVVTSTQAHNCEMYGRCGFKQVIVAR